MKRNEEDNYSAEGHNQSIAMSSLTPISIVDEGRFKNNKVAPRLYKG
jgi:hypothetical protein